jgi:hypothetical protein
LAQAVSDLSCDTIFASPGLILPWPTKQLEVKAARFVDSIGFKIFCEGVTGDFRQGSFVVNLGLSWRLAGAIVSYAESA